MANNSALMAMGMKPEEQPAPLSDAPALAEYRTMLAQNYPEGAGPGTAAYAAQKNSGSAGSGINASGPQSPVGNGVDNPQPAESDLVKDRGTPQEMIDKMGPGEIEEALQSSAQYVANMAPDEKGALVDPDLEKARIAAKKRSVGVAMSAQGADPQTALEKTREKKLADYEAMEASGEITKVQHSKLKERWKNIFNIIPKEDLGLVLMDFGFRAMAAGENLGSAAALGTAGLGALEGIKDRRESQYQGDVQQYNMAQQGALAERTDARADKAGVRADQAAQRATLEGPDTLNTGQGIYIWNPEKNQYEVAKDPETGNVLMPSALSGRPPVDDWKMKKWASAFPNWSEQRITMAVMSGVTPQQARQQATKSFDSYYQKGAVPIPGKGRVRASAITDADKKEFIDSQISSFGYGPEEDGSGALSPDGDNAADDNWLTTKPAGWTDVQWDEYSSMRKEATGK